MPTQAEIQNRILRNINQGVNRLGTSLDIGEKSRIKSFLAARNSGGQKIDSHDEFVNLVVNKPDDFKDKFVRHLQEKNGISIEEAEVLFNKLFQHATNEFENSIDKIAAEQQQARQQVQQDREQDRTFWQKSFNEKLKTDVTAAASEKLNRASERLDKASQSMKEYFPTFTKWGQRAGVVGADAAKAGGKAAIATAASVGYGSYALAKSSLGAAKQQVDKFSNGFFDIVLVLGILLHIVQGMTGGWQGPSPVAFKWAFIFLLIYFVLLLGAPNSINLRFKTFSAVSVFFLIEWQWFRIINLIGIGSRWWAFKALWPTVVIYWVYKSVVNEGKKPIMTWIASTLIIGFWVAFAYNAVNAGAYIEKYTPGGLSDQEYTQQKTGFYIALAEKLGYEKVSEFEYAAVEKCKNDFIFDYYLERGKLKILTKFVSPEFKKCVEQNVQLIAEEERIKQETERVLAARKQESRDDFTKLSLTESKPEISPSSEVKDGKEVITNADSSVIYNLKFTSSKKDVAATVIASLIKNGAKKEDGMPAKIECFGIDCEATVTGEGKAAKVEIAQESIARLENGADIKVSDEKTADAQSRFVKGENTVHFEANFKNLKTKTTLPVVFGIESAIKDVKKTVQIEEDKAANNPEYWFRYWNKVIERNSLPLNILAIYPNNKIEGVYSEQPVVVDIKPLSYIEPVMPVSVPVPDARAQTSQSTARGIAWKVDIFKAKDKEGKIKKINGITLYLPKGIVPDNEKCPFKKNEKIIREYGKNSNKISKIEYSLEEKNINALNVKERLAALNDVKDQTTTGIAQCEIRFELQELFGFNAESLGSKSVKQKFINQEFVVEMEYDYSLEKDTKVNIPYDIKREVLI